MLTSFFACLPSLYKRINDHLRNNIPILESDRAITDSILSAIAPVNAPERGLTEKSRISILKSSLALVRCVTVSVASTSLLLGALFCKSDRDTDDLLEGNLLTE